MYRNILSRFRHIKNKAIIAYLCVISIFLIGALIPECKDTVEKCKGVVDLIKSPFSIMQIDEFSIALCLALFLPLVFPYIKHLKIFGQEIELLERIQRDVQREKKELSIRQFDHERVLYAMVASMGRDLKTQSRPYDHVHEKRYITIGCKDFIESRILAEVIFLLLERNGIKVEPHIVQSTTLGCFFNLRIGKIDVYVEYSGTGFMLADEPPLTDEPLIADVQLIEQESALARKCLNKIYNEWELEWLPCIGFQNQEQLVMLKDTAEKYKIETYDHLKKHSKNFIFGAVHEFFLRDIGFPRLLEEGFNFSEVRDDVDIDDRLSGLLSNEFDVGVGWTTDPMRDNPLLLWIEQSSENTAISQYAMPLCRNVIRDKVQSILKELKIEEQEMRNMNRKAQRQGVATMTIRGIATDFLDKV